MELRQLGQSDLRISPLGIGAWAMGGGNWEFGWGPQRDEDSIQAISEGVALGMNWVDTAAVYGLGHSESVVGRAVRHFRPRPYVFTKCSLIWDESGNISHSLEANSIRRELESSLVRLGLDTIDLYQVHWPAWKGARENASRGSIEEAIGAMEDLRREGKLRYIGVSNFNVQQLKRAQSVASIVSLQPPYSLLARSVEVSILPYAKENRMGVMVYSPMASGMLSGAMTRQRIQDLPTADWRKKGRNFQEPLLSRNLMLVETLRRIGNRCNMTPGEVAIAWTLLNPAVTAAIVGARTAGQVSEIAGAAHVHLSPDEIAEIDAIAAQKAA